MIRHERRAAGKQWTVNAPELTLIAMDQRHPTEEDADIYGQILAWHRFNKWMPMSVGNALRNGFITHWTFAPRGPIEEEPK